MTLAIERVRYGGWKNNVRLANKEIELVVTEEVGPRIIRLGFAGTPNLFAEIGGQMGSVKEDEWLIRGGHRFWIAPEEKPKTYELDNDTVEIQRVAAGIRTIQAVGPLSGIQKTMEIKLAPNRNEATITHTLTNKGRKPVTVAPWALSAMAPNGMAIIPLPKRIPHTDRLTHNQEWSLWGYTALTDPRWTFGARYVFFRQDSKKGPNKLGMVHREGWVAYQLDGFLFVKWFQRTEGAAYPDGGCNFETFSNEDFMEVETLGPLTLLVPGQSVGHVETWQLFRGVQAIKTEADADRMVQRLIKKPTHA